MSDYNNYSDQELASLLSASDSGAFKLLYQRYWKKLFTIAASRLNEQMEGEEAVQDIFLNLWNRRSTFKLIGNFENYFAVAVKFEVINRLAKRSRQAARDQGYQQQLSQLIHPAYQHLDVELLQQQYNDVLHSLPEKCQLIFKMSREQEMTNKKIAHELGISEKAVEKHKTNALKVLRKRFGQHLPLILIFFAK